MMRYTLGRLSTFLPILLGVSVVVFLILHLAPGDPAVIHLKSAGIPVTEANIAAVRGEMGLDRPLPVQYAGWLRRAIRLDFGRSYLTGNPVLREVLHYLPRTLALSGGAFLLATLVGVPLGILSALHKDRVADNASRLLAFVGASIPGFWLGFLLMYLFALRLGWLPTMGRGGLRHMILPAVTLAASLTASLIRLVRSSMLENMNHRFVFYARARGIAPWRITCFHVVRVACLPVIAFMGMGFGHLVAGSVIVENVFAWPGLSRFAVAAVSARDIPVIQCYLLLMAGGYILLNLLVDLLHAGLDPRMRPGGAAA